VGSGFPVHSLVGGVARRLPAAQPRRPQVLRQTTVVQGNGLNRPADRHPHPLPDPLAVVLVVPQPPAGAGGPADLRQQGCLLRRKPLLPCGVVVSPGSPSFSVPGSTP
jgi:hypothetical protein